MEIDLLGGVPAHPLFVHLPVVLVPLAALGLLAALVVPRWRHWALPVALAFAAIGTVGTYLAKESGESLEHRVEDTRGESDLLEEHTEMGDTLLPWVAVFAALLAGATVLDARGRRGAGAAEEGGAARSDLARLATPVLAVALIGGGLATWKVYEVGHSGARAAWQDTTGASSSGSGDGGGGGYDDDDGD